MSIVSCSRKLLKRSAVRTFALSIISVLGATSLSLPAECSKPAASGQISGWVVDEDTSMFGAATLYVTKDAFKMVVPKLHLTLLCKAPDWKFIAFNTASKKYVLMDASEANSMFSFHRTRLRDNKEPEYGFFSENGQVCGMKTSNYLYPISPEALNLTKPEMQAFAMKLESHKPLSAKEKKTWDEIKHSKYRAYWMAQDIPLPKQVAKVFALEGNRSGGLLLPLRISVFMPESRGKSVTSCEAKSAKKITLTAADFEKPVGFTRAPNQLAMLLDDGEMDSEDSLLPPDQMSHLKKHLAAPAPNAH